MWLQNTFVDKIMLKNKRAELEAIKLNLASGDTNIPSELENLMIIEAKEKIRAYYDNKEGAKDLFLKMKTSKDKSKSILELTAFDKKVKLNEMTYTWEFTRSIPMILHFFETFFYILISNSQYIIYFCMIFSMY